MTLQYHNLNLICLSHQILASDAAHYIVLQALNHPPLNCQCDFQIPSSSYLSWLARPAGAKHCYVLKSPPSVLSLRLTFYSFVKQTSYMQGQRMCAAHSCSTADVPAFTRCRCLPCLFHTSAHRASEALHMRSASPQQLQPASCLRGAGELCRTESFSGSGPALPTIKFSIDSFISVHREPCVA